MKIALIGKFYTEGFALHIEEALHTMGHSTVRIDPEVQFMQYNFLGQRVKSINKTIYQQVLHKIPQIRNIKAKEIYKIYQNNEIDLTIVVHDFLSKQEIEQIKKINKAPIAIWFPDHMGNFQKSMFYIAGYDFLFFKDKYIVQKLRDEFNLNAFYLPQCCNPSKHKIVSLSEQDKITYGCQITNAGNLYPSRAALYKQLTQYDFKMWGAPPAIWLNVPELKHIMMGKSVFNEEKSKAFQSAKIVLNNMLMQELDGVNKRTFEVAACGGFQIATHNKEINNLFEEDKEIVTYKNFKELKSKIDYYLDPKNEAERKQIITAGHKRSINDHTYEIRMKSMLNTIFGK